MKTSPSATALEKVAGSVLVEATATAITVLVGGPLAAMLPILLKSLASERYKKRNDEFLQVVSATLERHENEIRNLSDAQYKLINEAVLAALHTTEVEKLKMLQTAVKRTLDLRDVQPQEAILLSRIIRDISAEEAHFVLRNFAFTAIHISEPGEPEERGVLHVAPGSRDELLVSGLNSLGVLTTGQPTMGQLLRFSSIVAKLILLLQDNDT